ncbi:hypothetical protein D0817_20870 [Flavobacterium cupreum]|uniref:Uncharacterized protein n=1 Tax=Flavobacterium cupreum TaxID=2133766 RepID=A0A434A2F9_9FLAO|nr:hypothetical protein [Flavobacterium cupreum]RUT68579.1 hypothetical protein D0817_20870 [Flavobacterium cupreum]
MNKRFDLVSEFNLHLDDDYKESMKITPSYYILEGYASKLLELIKQWEQLEPDTAEELYSLERKIKLLQVDLSGHLKHDLKKENKQYRTNWLILKDNVQAMKHELLNLWKEKNKD